jgi:hypothetical protein
MMAIPFDLRIVIETGGVCLDPDQTQLAGELGLSLAHRQPRPTMR